MAMILFPEQQQQQQKQQQQQFMRMMPRLRGIWTAGGRVAVCKEQGQLPQMQRGGKYIRMKQDTSKYPLLVNN